MGLVLITLLFSLDFSPPGTGWFPMYFATFFCFLLAAVWRPGRGDGPFPRKALVFALGIVAAGVAIGVLQELATTERHAQLGDVLSGIIGAFSALAIQAWMRRAWGSTTG